MVVLRCATDSASVAAACYDNATPYPGPGTSTANYRASSNDPGYLDISGYAFLAADADAAARVSQLCGALLTGASST